MEQDIAAPMEELRVGGGAAPNNFLCQFQADILGIPVVRPRHLETTSLGAAYAAGIAVGLWDGPATVAEAWKEERRFLPRLSAGRREELLDSWTRAVKRSKGWDIGSVDQEAE
jgi:glycerol kinase